MNPFDVMYAQSTGAGGGGGGGGGSGKSTPGYAGYAVPYVSVAEGEVVESASHD